MSPESSASSTGPALRQLRWPTPPVVDLLDEFYWLVSPSERESERTSGKGHHEHAEETRRQLLAGCNAAQQQQRPAGGQSSPYRQQLRRPKPPAPTPGSPAQQAARQILQLKDELLRLKDGEWLLQDDTALALGAVAVPNSGKHRQRPDNRASRSPIKPIQENDQSKNPYQPVSTASPSSRSPSHRGQSRKKKRVVTQEERQLYEQQTRLAAWLQTHPDRVPTSLDSDVRVGSDGSTASVVDNGYSHEMEARIETAMQCRAPLEAGVSLWDDPVRSILAAEMTSETVFGGLVPTRGLAFQSSPPKSPPQSPALHRAASFAFPSQNSPDKAPLSCDAVDSTLNTPAHVGPISPVQHTLTDVKARNVSTGSAVFELSDHARQVHSTARRQVADGAVSDALATLEAGIRQSLSTAQAHQDAASASNGPAFNYSALAHTKATQLQLVYRNRHRRRLERLVFLQRQWRSWFAAHSVATAARYERENALVIQRAYRRWYVRKTRERSALRLQRCFRTFESQKHLIRFRQVCRLLVARERQRRAKRARQRRLWSRVRLVGRLVLTWQARRRQVVRIQSLWRGRCARAQFVARLETVSAAESARRAREDAFVAARLALVRSHFRSFLSTKRGRELVRWQQEKPWLRFRRLRRHRVGWEQLPLDDKVEVLTALLPGRRLRGLQRRSLCQLLLGTRTPLPTLPRVVEVSVDGLQFLTATSTAVSVNTTEVLPPVGCCPWWATVRRRLQSLRQRITQRVATAWWPLVLWPQEFCRARLWPNRSRRRLRARQQLEDDCARVVTAFLRERFRQTSGEANRPPYACQWCSEPFAVASDFFAHRQCQAARSRAAKEWQALELDLEFALRRPWHKWRAAAVHKYVQRDFGAFQLDESTVRGLRRSRNGRALRALLAVLEACAGGSGDQEQVVPLPLLGFLMRYIGQDDGLHPLLRGAELQLVRAHWGPTHCVSKLDLRARLPLEPRWRLRWRASGRKLLVFPRWRARVVLAT